MSRLKRCALVVLAAACARQGMPPGGQPRFTPPALIATFPADSVCNVADIRGDAVFQFDEVISEGSQPNFGYGTGDLERLVVLSPDTAVPVVRWRRDRITVHPRDGWKAGRVYRIELAPGVTDLWRNVTKTGAVIGFGAGTPCPSRTLSGRAIDWSARRGVPQALIDAVHLPDSLGYRTIADSTGRFRLRRLPDGYYLVRATIDQNRDHHAQPSEAWDTVRVGPGIDTTGEIWAFVRDTLAPKIQTATRLDSQAISVTFTKPIDPYQRLDSTSIRVLLVISPTDSGTIGPIAAFPKAVYDSLYPATTPHPARADTGKAHPASAARDSMVRDSLARDSAARAARARPGRRGAGAPPPVDLPKEKRPDLGSILVIRTLGRVGYDKRYYIALRDVRMAGGAKGPATYTLQTPKAPSDTTRSDSLARARGDTGRRGKRDTTAVHKPPFQ